MTRGQEKQPDLFRQDRITKSFVDYLVDNGFIGECSVVKRHMKTSANIFNASCVFHDVCYTAGGDEADRRRADSGFYRRCMQNTAALKKVRHIWYFAVVASVWFVMVRVFGWMAFKYGPCRSAEEILELNHKTKSGTLTMKLTDKVKRAWLIIVKISTSLFESMWSKVSPKIKWIRSTLSSINWRSKK